MTYEIREIIPYKENEGISLGQYDILNNDVIIGKIKIFNKKIRLDTNNKNFMFDKSENFIEVVKSGRMEEEYYQELIENTKPVCLCGL